MSKKSDQYLKLVEWSEEDQCYIGRCPGLMVGGVHGDDEAKVYKELCQVVEEWIQISEADGLALPEGFAQKEYSGKFLLRVGADLHRILDARAKAAGISLNRYCEKVLGDNAFHSPSGGWEIVKRDSGSGRIVSGFSGVGSPVRPKKKARKAAKKKS